MKRCCRTWGSNRDRVHIRQMRIRPSCHARLRPSKNSLCLSCIIPRALFKPFKQMGWKWRFSKGNHQTIHKQNNFFFSNKSSCECFLIYCLCQSLLWAKDEICKDYFRGFLGAKPPRSQIIFIFWQCSQLPTCYSGISPLPVCVTVYCR